MLGILLTAYCLLPTFLRTDATKRPSAEAAA